jgi:sugar fermentation stimulation protein A
MNPDYLYQYPPLLAGTLVKRYKRFLADIELESGEVITAHCPNTGPMTGICTPGSAVYVSKSDNPKRKLPYTWEMIQVQDTVPTWVGVNTAMPNRVMKLALTQKVITELADQYSQVKPEVPYGTEKKSRIDFLLTGEDTQLPIYVEVKSATWVDKDLALFPDTVTTRGQKHLRELTALVGQAHPVILYFINRGDCPTFAPGDQGDPKYGELLREAVEKGVTVLPCRFEITPEGIRYLGLAQFLPKQP